MDVLPVFIATSAEPWAAVEGYDRMTASLSACPRTIGK